MKRRLKASGLIHIKGWTNINGKWDNSKTFTDQLEKKITGLDMKVV
jgi:hypothetical protein